MIESPSLLVISMVLAAAFLHAVWNAMIKGSGDRVLTMGFINLGHAVFGVPLVLLYAPPLAESWPFLIASTVIHYFYYGFLLLAYRYGDLSHVYPIARGIAPVLVAVGTWFFIGETLEFGGWLGIALVCGGIFMLFFGSSGAPAGKIAIFAALITGFTIAAYTIVDGIGVRASGSRIGYIGWLFLLEGLSVIVLLGWRRKQLVQSTPRFIFTGIIGGVISALAYGLAIYAMSLTQFANVSAIRESSVIIAALIGVIWFGERPWKLRVVAAVVVASGVVALTTL
ncbi:MAG: EamA family transporter [Pseudomonadota bacterium]